MQITKELAYKYYIIENHNFKETMEYFSIYQKKLKEFFDKNNIRKTTKEASLKRNLSSRLFETLDKKAFIVDHENNFSNNDLMIKCSLTKRQLSYIFKKLNLVNNYFKTVVNQEAVILHTNNDIIEFLEDDN